MIQDEVFEKAISTYGIQNQIDMCIEEMAELTKALLKFRRFPESKAVLDNVLEEISDVHITLSQMQLFFHVPDRYVDSKIKRLADKLGVVYTPVPRPNPEKVKTRGGITMYRYKCPNCGKCTYSSSPDKGNEPCPYCSHPYSQLCPENEAPNSSPDSAKNSGDTKEK